MTKSTLLKAINSIELYSNYLTALGQQGIEILDDNPSTQMMNTLIDLIYSQLSETVRNLNLIEEYCWECNFGKNPKEITVAGVTYVLDSIDTLYKAIYLDH